jgi:predicted Zn finger-like uncharacterized protein
MTASDSTGEMTSTVFALNHTCPDCGSTEFELRNYNLGAYTGQVYCSHCGEFITTMRPNNQEETA